MKIYVVVYFSRPIELKDAVKKAHKIARKLDMPVAITINSIYAEDSLIISPEHSIDEILKAINTLYQITPDIMVCCEGKLTC